MAEIKDPIDVPELELNLTNRYVYSMGFSTDHDYYKKNVVYYLQLGDIRVYLDHRRWNSSNTDELLRDCKQAFDHPDFGTKQAYILYNFCRDTNNSKLLKLLLRSRVKIGGDSPKLRRDVLDEELLDILLETDHSKEFIRTLVIDNEKIELLHYLESVNGLDISAYIDSPHKLFLIGDVNCFSFIYDRLIEAIGKNAIDQCVSADIIENMPVAIMSLLLTKYSFDLSGYVDVLWRRASLGYGEFIKLVYPCLTSLIESEKELIETSPACLATVCNMFLSLGADFKNVKEIFSASILGENLRSDENDQLSSSARYVSKEFFKVTQKIVLDFYENRIVTKENSDELYTECTQLIHGASVEICLGNESIVTASARVLSVMEQFVGLHIRIGDTRVPLMTAYPSQGCQYCFIYDKIVELFEFDYAAFTDQIKRTLLDFCFTFAGSLLESPDSLMYNQIMDDHYKTIMFLINNGTDIAPLLEDADTVSDITFNRVELVEVLLDAGMKKELVLKDAISNERIHVIDYLFQRYPSVETVQEHAIVYKKEITKLVVDFLTASNDGYTREETVQQLITRSKLTDLVSHSGYANVNDVLDNYRYLLDNGLDCRAYEDLIAFNAGRRRANYLIWVSLPYRFKSDNKTVRGDLILIMEAMGKTGREYDIVVDGLFDIIKAFLESGAFDDETDDMLEVLRLYKNSDKWRLSRPGQCLGCKTYFFETKIKYRIDSLLHQYALKIIGPNYKHMLD